MTEAKAIVLIFIAMVVLLVAEVLALSALDANEGFYPLAMILAGGGGACASSRVVMHYAPSKRRRR